MKKSLIYVSVIFILISSLLTVLYPVQICSASEIDFGLIGYWKFDEGSENIAHDSSGNENHAAINEANWISGVQGNALIITDTSIVYDLSDSLDDSISTAFTISGWILWYGPNDQGRSSYIFDERTTYSGFIFFITIDGNLQLNVYKTHDEIQTIQSRNIIPQNKWVYVAAVFDYSSRIIRVFIDGQEDNVTTANSPYKDSSLSPAIGNNLWAPGDHQWAPFNGVIDEIRLYDKALSNSEIQLLANSDNQSIFMLILIIGIIIIVIMLLIILLYVFLKRRKLENKEEIAKKVVDTEKDNWIYLKQMKKMGGVYCPNCGIKLKGTQNFCFKCGYKLK